jgi:hypothetical protein
MQPKGGRPRKYEQFPDIVPGLEAFAQAHGWVCDPKRRNDEGRMDEGFSLEEARDHLLKTIPGLYVAGLSIKTVHHLFYPPKKNNRAAQQYFKQVNAKVTPVRNDARAMTGEVHYVRAQQKLFQEFAAYHGQPWFSGDDMNIIQIGRPAVSRYHMNSTPAQMQAIGLPPVILLKDSTIFLLLFICVLTHIDSGHMSVVLFTLK